MFGFSKSKREPSAEPPKKRWFGRFKDGLGNLILGKKTIDADLLDELETLLLTADVGVEASRRILDNLAQQIARKELSNPESLLKSLKQQLFLILRPCQQPLIPSSSPFVILTVGVNGVGKTTTIAKMAHYYKQQGKKIMLAAGDTFRAAAVDQLKVWGERNQVPVIAQQSGSDSASVIYDAMESASAKNIDVLIADTAGRLHTQSHLMAELQKIKRVMQKQNSAAPHEILLIIDAGTGQNAINQAQQFHEAIGLTGIALTKLDGTAKGGIIFAIAEKMKLPIRFIGVGEHIDDLKPFEAQSFIDTLFEET